MSDCGRSRKDPERSVYLAVNTLELAPALFVLLLGLVLTASLAICDQAYLREESMLYYALVSLILGLLANLLGAYGVAVVASQIAWVLFVIGIVLIILHLVAGRRRRTVVP